MREKTLVIGGLVLLITAGGAAGQGEARTRTRPARAEAPAWREAERGILENHVQLTFREQFLKAGESYFSPDDSKIIFQAVEAPAPGEEAEDLYGMYVADVERDRRGRITGLANVRRISPRGSANTCGWFHPIEKDVVLFASTIGPPTESTPPGYQRSNKRYKWMFPPEMRLVRASLDRADGTEESLEVIYGDEHGYQAEASLSVDGRHLLFCSLESGLGDLFVRDMRSGKVARVVQAEGYDGGPFFSPDGQRLCYRSDRRGDNLLQIFVADLATADDGRIVGIEREFQLTDNGDVNWCPYWHPGGRYLVYATSALGHQNYEVFIVDADPGELSGSTGSLKYGTRQRRITHADGADILPVFAHDGRTLIWTSQRDESRTSQLWVADFVFDPDRRDVEKGATAEASTGGRGETAPGAMQVTDPDTGLVYLYDMSTHELSVYDPTTHRKRIVDDPVEMERATELFRQRDEP